MKTTYENVGARTSNELSLEKAYEGNRIEYFSDCPTPTPENTTGILFDSDDENNFDNRC